MQTTQRLVQQAVQQAAQRLQGSQSSAASQQLSAFNALMFPGLMQNNAAVHPPQV